MLAILVVLLLLAWALTSPFYWWRRGVPSVLPLPLLGNCLATVYLSSRDFLSSLYNRFPEAPYVGVFILTRPALLLKDPKVIHEVLEVKASSFASHGVYLNPARDLIAGSLFHLCGSEWKAVRSKMSPYFSPAKIKAAMALGKQSVEKLVEDVERALDRQANGGSVGEIEMHSAAMFLSIDFTTSTIFGIDSNIYVEKQESDFYVSAKDLNTPSSMMKVLVGMVSPALFDFFKLIMFTSRANAFLGRMLGSSMAARSKHVQTKQILMDGLLDIMSTHGGDEFVLAQGTVVWAGGVETTALALSFALYELALHQDIQRELRERLDTAQGQVLLRQIISETLRKYPLFGLLTRKCTQKCRLSTGLEVEAGTLLLIPLVSIHHDPKHFPDPGDFRPGREEPNGAYLPFGAGPRTCLGMRMATALLESCLSRLLERYEFHPGHLPLVLEPKSFFTAPKGGVWLKVRRVSEGNDAQ